MVAGVNDRTAAPDVSIGDKTRLQFLYFERHLHR